MECRICGNSSNNIPFRAKEMMFGYKDEFEYIECASCGCLQIAEYPNNIQKYYPSEYYSFNEKLEAEIAPVKRLKNKLKLYLRYYFASLFRALPSNYHPPYFKWFERIKMLPKYKILDLGCGRGLLLVDLYKDGFDNLFGADKFIEKDISYFDGKLRIYKKDIEEFQGQLFDLVLLNHVLEHMPDQEGTLVKANKLLRTGHYLILRIPVKSFAWEKYKQDWVQLDAPRHFYIHTIQSVQILAEKCGFSVEDVVFDSYALQFWGSEQYLKDIPLASANSFAQSQEKSIFTTSQVEAYEKESIELNQKKQGDQAIFYLKKMKSAG